MMRPFCAAAAVACCVPLFAADPVLAQCDPTWDLSIGAPGVGNGYAGPMSTWDSGAGEGLYVGGSFSVIGGLGYRGIARWNPGTHAWSPLSSGCYTTNTNYFVAAIAPHNPGTGENLFVGGSFATAGGISGTTNLARWTGTAWMSLGPTPSGQYGRWRLGTGGCTSGAGSRRSGRRR